MSKVIEFSGTPDAGKTTVISRLKKILEEKGKNVILLGEANGLELPPQDLRGTIKYNEWVGKNACEGIINAVNQNPDIVLVDRGIIDFRFWNYLYKKNGKATEEEVAEIQNQEVFQDKRLIPDLLIAVTVSIDEAIRRNPNLARKRRWVENHNDLFEKFYDTYKGNKTKIDTTELSKEDVENEILKLLQRSNMIEMEENDLTK